jgi:hypothetical protein
MVALGASTRSVRTSRHDKRLVPTWSAIDSGTPWRLQGKQNPVKAVLNQHVGAPRYAIRCPGQGAGHLPATENTRGSSQRESSATCG